MKKVSYIGQVGSLIPFVPFFDVETTEDSAPVFVDTLGGRKAFTPARRGGKRVWSVSVPHASPGELSALRWLAEYTGGPMVWFPSDAVVGNILTPDVAGLIPGTHDGLEGALVEVESGVWVKSAHPDDGGGISLPYRSGSLSPIPVIAGQPVTVSAWMRGAACRIDVNWRDLSGVSVGSSAGPQQSLSSLTRVHRSLVAPVNAHQLTLRLRATQSAGPAVTFTDTLLPYSPGRGAFRVVAHGLSDAVLRATEDQQYQSLSFTVSEVG